MIIDAYLYNGETEMESLRSHTLAGTVDAYVAVVCSLTHQGEPNPIAYDFYPPATQVVTPARTFPPGCRGSVAGHPFFQLIERQHRALVRHAVSRAFPHLQPDDVVCVSDVDEIPDPQAVTDTARDIAQHGGVKVLEQRWYSDNLRHLHPHQPWLGTTVSRFEECAPQRHRDLRGPLHEQGRSVREGGWHLSWFGTDEARDRKLRTFSHGELLGRYDPAEGRAAGKHSDGQPLQDAPPATDLPRPLLDGTFPIPEAWK